MNIPHYLIEAYLGRFEEEYQALHPEYEEYVKREGRNGEVAVEAFDLWLEHKAHAHILGHSPLQRLEVYLEWEGIIGFTSRIWAITQGFEEPELVKEASL